ncbi:cytochrome B6 [Cyanobium sp. Morenito 9A2]|uniref:cytochrome B6 n=1 Tax=Cyanobium sp. Morenito 9A2 TaxID=2823718 RepID=UPI0020CC38E0|nr:cytochrome B6 [Cyanobium sp. Morenito 9A2]MCP9850325.1 cytochrome B6 [Cyanobium sp. Morenito 9A2]
MVLQRWPDAWLTVPTLAFSTAGDAAQGLIFGWNIADLQTWTLVYLGVSSLAFVVVWVVGLVRRSGPPQP